MAGTAAASARADEGIAWAPLVLGLYLPSAIQGIGLGVVPPSIPALASLYGVAPAVAAQVVTAQSMGRFATLIPAGWVADRIGGYMAMRVGAALMVAAALVSTTAPVFWLVLVGQALTGMGLGLWGVGRELTSVDLVPKGRRGMMMSSYYGLTSAMQALGPLLGGVATDHFGARSVFMIQATFAALQLTLALTIRERPVARRRAAAQSTVVPRLSALEPKYRGTFVVLMYGSFCASVRSNAINALLPLLGTGAGLSSTQIGSLFGVVAVVNLLMIAPAGYVSDHVGRKAAVIPTAAFAALAFALYPFAHEYWQFAAIGVIVGIASGFGLGSMTTFTFDITPAAVRGSFQGMRRSSGELGGLFGPSVGGLVASVASVPMAFLALAPLHALSAVLLWVVAKESLRAEET